MLPSVFLGTTWALVKPQLFCKIVDCIDLTGFLLLRLTIFQVQSFLEFYRQVLYSANYKSQLMPQNISLASIFDLIIVGLQLELLTTAFQQSYLSKNFFHLVYLFLTIYDLVKHFCLSHLIRE